MNQESATLVLRSCNCSAGNVTNNSWKWTEINLKQALGTIFEKYDTFKICLTGFGSQSATITAVDDRNVNLNIAGLNWINSGYDYASNAKLNTVTFGAVDLVSGSGRVVNYNGNYGYMFKKPPNGWVDISLTYTRVADNSINTSQVYANNVLYFTIIGIDLK
jgi:hypothetical protein